MIVPVTKVNNFIEHASKHFIDSASKFFILTELLFGVYRITLIGNIWRAFLYFSRFYIILVYSSIIASVIYFALTPEFRYTVLLEVFKFVLCNILNCTFRNRLQLFYEEINMVDKIIPYKVKVFYSSIQNIVQMFLTLIFTFSLIFKSFRYDPAFYHVICLVTFVKVCHALELHYYAHLITLMRPRIRIIIDYMKISFPSNKYSGEFNPIDDKFLRLKNRLRHLSPIEMDVLMDLYYNIIKAYDSLNSAVKWQMLLLLSVSFSVALNFLFVISINIINGDFNADYLRLVIAMVSLEITPVFATCLYGDQVSKEIRDLREALLRNLYENGLDKENRSTAQAFLGLTETRDLTFTLFDMFAVDISLPFKIMGLLLTYLIILLQFNKVVNPTTKVTKV